MTRSLVPPAADDFVGWLADDIKLYRVVKLRSAVEQEEGKEEKMGAGIRYGERSME